MEMLNLDLSFVWYNVNIKLRFFFLSRVKISIVFDYSPVYRKLMYILWCIFFLIDSRRKNKNKHKNASITGAYDFYHRKKKKKINIIINLDFTCESWKNVRFLKTLPKNRPCAPYVGWVLNSASSQPLNKDTTNHKGCYRKYIPSKSHWCGSLTGVRLWRYSN